MSLYTLEQKQVLSFKIEFEADVPAERAFMVLSDLSKRVEWDPNYEWVSWESVCTDRQTDTHTNTGPSLKWRIRPQEYTEQPPALHSLCHWLLLIS